MERPSKKLAPKFDSFYPSKEELDWLANNNRFDKLNNRLADKTTENAIKDILIRRKNELNVTKLNNLVNREKFPLDIIKKIALSMDIRNVLDLSMKSSTFLIIVTDDEFWKERFKIDFPEILNVFKDFDPGSIVGTEKFKRQPWRRFYNVVRYYMVRMVYPVVASYLTDISKRGNLHLCFSFRYYRKQNNFGLTLLESETNLKLGEHKTIDLAEALSLSKLDRIEYFRDYAQFRVAQIFSYSDEKEALKILINNNSSTLTMVIGQGYAIKDNEKIVIG